MRLRLPAAALLAAIFLANHASAQGGAPVQEAAPAQTSTTTWEVLTGVDYSVGDYGAASDTTIISVPLSAKAQIDRLRLELTVPYVDINGPGTSAGGGIIVPGNKAVTHRSGLGDITAGAAWLINRGGQSAPSFEIAGLVKVPTAGSGLGTQKFDYAAQMNVYEPLSSQFLLFGSAGYQWLGDFGTVKLEDGVVASAGLNYKPMESISTGFGVNYHQEYLHGLGDVFSLSPYLQWNFGGMFRVGAYGLVGLTNASPRFGGGLRLGLYG